MMTKVKEILSNSIWMPIILTFGFLGWSFNFDLVTIPILCIFNALVLIFCDDIKNIFPLILTVAFFINSVDTVVSIVVLAVSLGIFLIGVIYFIIKQFLNQAPMRKGKMFWAFVASTIAMLAGGIIGYFNFLYFIIILAFALISYFLYWAILNFCPNFKDYIIQTFLVIASILCVQLLMSYILVEDGFWTAITSKSVPFIGLQNINVVAIYFMIAMVLTFYLGIKHRFDYLYTLLAMWFAICTYFTYSRMGTLICFIAMVALIIFTFIKSKNKAIYLFTGIVLLFIAQLTFVLLYDKIMKLFTWHSSLGVSGNGRDALWPWCWEKFLESPLFGVGYVSNKEPVPSLMTTDTIILAHNNLLQYLTSLGIFGTILMMYYNTQKYILAFQKFNLFKAFNFINLFIISLSGITDQSPTMDIFMTTIIIIFTVLAEKDTDEHKSTVEITHQELTDNTQQHTEVAKS